MFQRFLLLLLCLVLLAIVMPGSTMAMAGDGPNNECMACYDAAEFTMLEYTVQASGLDLMFSDNYITILIQSPPVGLVNKERPGSRLSVLKCPMIV